MINSSRDSAILQELLQAAGSAQSSSRLPPLCEGFTNAGPASCDRGTGTGDHVDG